MSEYYCTNCNAILNDQPGFDPSLGVWTCTECGQTLYGDEVAETMTLFPDGVWYCDSCGAVLSLQPGFHDTCRTWECTECGYMNPINEDELYESEDDFQRNKHIYECPNCGNPLNDQAGFKNTDTYTCEWCNTELYKDGIDYRILYTCPNCGASLNDQWMFSEDDEWKCEECYTQLSRDGNKYTICDDEYEDEDDDDDENEDEDDDENEDEVDDDDEYEDEVDDDEYEDEYYDEYDNGDGDIDDELDENEYNDEEYVTSYNVPYKKHKGVTVILWLIVFLMMFIGVGYYEYTLLIPINYSDRNLKGEDYEEVVDKIKENGFTYVRTQEISDLDIQLISSDNKVTEIKIGWISSFEKDTNIPSNFPITVIYHSLKRIPVPMSSKEAKGSNYEIVVNAFKECGFIDVEIDEKKDIITGWLTKEGEVDSVLIGNTKKFSSEDEFKPNEKVIVTYHTFR